MTIKLTNENGAVKPKKAETAKTAPKAKKENDEAQVTTQVTGAPVDEGAKAKAAMKANAPVSSAVEDSIVGSKSETLELVAPLVDPTIPDKTPITINGKKETIETGTIVGYRFKSSEPITIPFCGLSSAFKRNRMDFVDINGEKQVAAGEEFDLTPFELGALMSRPEYNAYALGGKHHVRCVYRADGARKKDGSVERVSESSAVPGVNLRGVDGTVVKTMKMIPVLSFTKSKKSDKGVTKITRTINPGFERWQVLCESAAPKSSAKPAVDARKVYNEGAQAFLNIVNAKKKRGA